LVSIPISIHIFTRPIWEARYSRWAPLKTDAKSRATASIRQPELLHFSEDNKKAPQCRARKVWLETM
jgi:hypothetical protein